MNLVIKIPKDAYDLLQGEGVDWLGAEHILDAVAKGEPVEECEDCVSLDAVIDVFDTWWAYNHESDNAIEILEDKLNALPPVKSMEKVRQSFEGMTNGEVIKVLFPKIDDNFSNVIDLRLWWNAPYKGGAE